MQRVVLQIPMKKKLREEAEKAAAEYGFSSLQEILRVFMKDLAEKKISPTFEKEEVIHLSKAAAKRYDKITKDIESGKEKVYTANNLDELMKQLHTKIDDD